MLEKINIIDKVTIKEIRVLSGKTQEEFAKFVDIPYTTYRRYEKDYRKIALDKLFKISDKCGIPIEHIKLT